MSRPRKEQEFAEAIAQRDESACRNSFLPYCIDEVADNDANFDDFTFLWPIITSQPKNRATEIIVSCLLCGDRNVVAFILDNIPEYLDDETFGSLLTTEVSEPVIAFITAHRPLAFDHVDKWAILGNSEATSELIIEAGFGLKLRPDSHTFSHDFIKRHARAMGLQDFVLQLDVDEHSFSPTTMVAISLCETMPSVDVMREFVKEYTRMCCCDVPPEFAAEAHRATVRVRAYYEGRLAIPDLSIRT